MLKFNFYHNRKDNFYSNKVERETTGLIGYIRGDFGSGGNGFHHSWFENKGKLNNEVFKEDLNKVMEFFGEGVANLTVDERIGVDVMTTETACLSSIWETDGKVKDFYTVHGRPNDYKALSPEKVAYYDMAIRIDLSKIESMIALPFHPSNASTIKDFLSRPYELLKEAEEAGQKLLPEGKGQFKLTDKIKDGKVYVEQGVIAGCAGGMYENIAEASNIIGDDLINNNDFTL